jgi:Protein of unknown function (DUF3768)
MLRRATMCNGDALKRINRIRVLNDNFRSSFVGGQVFITAGVADLPLALRVQVMIDVQNFSEFTADNDPHGEHDFGAFELAGQRFFWKIDYYGRDVMFGSEDPADPEKTTRVLTIMLADEY